MGRKKKKNNLKNLLLTLLILIILIVLNHFGMIEKIWGGEFLIDLK